MCFDIVMGLEEIPRGAKVTYREAVRELCLKIGFNINGAHFKRRL